VLTFISRCALVQYLKRLQKLYKQITGLDVSGQTNIYSYYNFYFEFYNAMVYISCSINCVYVLCIYIRNVYWGSVVELLIETK
jgi:hypothetical protein